MSPVCANCEEVIVSTPFLDEGQTYCCSGCAHGGPCICTYRDATIDPASWNETPTAPEVVVGPTAVETQYVTASTALAAEPQREPEREPAATLPSQPLAWPAPDRAGVTIARRPSILRISGLQTQTELLQLGYALEQQPEIEDLSLVRAELDDVWFAVSVRDSDALAEALVRIEGFTGDARPHPAGVDATIRPLPAGGAVAEVAPAAEPMVATAARSLFRLFRRGDERPSEPQIEVETVAAPVYEAPVACEATPVAEPVVEAVPAVAAAVAEPVAAFETYVAPEPVVAVAPASPLDAPAIVAPAATAAIQMAPNVATAASDMLSADARPGGAVTMREHLTIVAYPFRSFVALNEFQDATRALHGVINVKVRRFYRGTLHLGVEYEDVLPLAERLRDLQGFTWRLVSNSPQEIELTLEEQGDPVSSG